MADIGIQRTILKGNRYGALDFFEPEHSLLLPSYILQYRLVRNFYFRIYRIKNRRRPGVIM